MSAPLHGPAVPPPDAVDPADRPGVVREPKHAEFYADRALFRQRIRLMALTLAGLGLAVLLG